MFGIPDDGNRSKSIMNTGKRRSSLCLLLALRMFWTSKEKLHCMIPNIFMYAEIIALCTSALSSVGMQGGDVKVEMRESADSLRQGEKFLREQPEEHRHRETPAVSLIVKGTLDPLSFLSQFDIYTLNVFPCM